MIYMTILGLIALLSLKVGIGSINQVASESGDHPELFALLAVGAFTALSWSLALMYGLYSFQGLQ
jgi:hypothetical protein